MISYFRRLFVDSWLGRVFALLIFAAFVAWGVGDFFTNMGRNDAGTVATAGGQKVGVADFDRAFRQQLDQVARQTGGDASQISPSERGQVALQVLQGLVGRALAVQEARRLGVVVPDDVLRQAIFDVPLFKGVDGRFDRARFDQWLSANQYTEAKLLALFRDDLLANALIEPIRVGARAPGLLVRRAYDYAAQTRTLDLLRIPFSAMPAPASPGQAELRRYFDNHPAQFQAPEYRRIKLVLLSPLTVARGMEVSEADERALFRSQAAPGGAGGNVPEKRSVEVITAPSEARAAALAMLWKGGAGWPQMQAAAGDSVPVALDDAPRSLFPDPALGAIAFAARPDEVTGPVHLAAGWVLLRVTRLTPAVVHDFEQLRPQLRDAIATARARDGMADRVQKLQDAIAGGSGLDQVPADLGAAALAGTLDARGVTPAGAAAPLPGPPALRAAIIAQAFAQKPGAPPEIKQGPDDSEFVVSVEQSIPPHALDYLGVQDRVREAVLRDAVRRAAETQAAALYTQARRAGLAALGRPDVVHAPPVGRGQVSSAVPADLVRLAFSLPVGDSTMLQVPDGFVVATVTGAQHPDPASNRLAYDRMQSSLDAAVGDDIEASYAVALRRNTRAVINPQALRSVVGE